MGRGVTGAGHDQGVGGAESRRRHRRARPPGAGRPQNDEGICIHVYGNDIAGDDKELLRLDCFKYDPHYHYRNATVKQNERLLLDYTAEGGSVEWALDKIKNRLPAMLLRCQAGETARGLDQRDVDAALPKIAAWAESKTRESYG